VSNEERFKNLAPLIKQVEPRFNELANIHNAVNFKREASFSMQILKDNNYLAQTAMSNPDSLKRAVINVAAIGLSLNPVEKLAYLVPRDKKVCLDISYRGYVQLGVQIGAIKWAKAEVVKESDNFKYLGLGKEPLHEFNPFAKDRGEIIGAYCVAKTHDGEYITEMMPIADIYSTRDRSAAWKAYVRDNSKKNPWVTDESEMIKKTVIRRAYKSWPMTDTRIRIDQAVQVSAETEEIDLDSPEVSTASEFNDQIIQIREHLDYLDRSEEQFTEHLVRVHSREIKSLEELTESELSQAVAMLEQFSVAKRGRERANEDVG
jgi:recombination protein RecT